MGRPQALNAHDFLGVEGRNTGAGCAPLRKGGQNGLSNTVQERAASIKLNVNGILRVLRSVRGKKPGVRFSCCSVGETPKSTEDLHLHLHLFERSSNSGGGNGWSHCGHPCQSSDQSQFPEHLGSKT